VFTFLGYVYGTHGPHANFADACAATHVVNIAQGQASEPTKPSNSKLQVGTAFSLALRTWTKSDADRSGAERAHAARQRLVYPPALHAEYPKLPGDESARAQWA